MNDRPVDAEEVSRVAALADPVVRNVWITQVYAGLGARMQRAIGSDDHTWCGFAVWASATAGQSIRRQELPWNIVAILGASDNRQDDIDALNRRFRLLRALKLAPFVEHVHVLRTFDGAIDSVADHIGHGNALVFGELAPLFVAFLELVEDGDPRGISEAELDAALDAAAARPIEPGVRLAFACYLRACATTDPRERAWAVLAANVLAVAHEQRRLQDDIAAAIDAGLFSAEHVVAELLPRWAPAGAIRLIASLARRPVEALVRTAWDDVATELLMTLRVPGAALRLCHTLPPLAGGRRFPADLSELGDSDDARVFAGWDRTHGSGRHVGARDWVAIGERMNFIVNLFRSRQQDTTLAAAPFTATQLEQLRAGHLPSPPLLPPLPGATRRPTPRAE